MKVSLDSRLIKPGEYFVPVVGENFDGHKFIDAAWKNGAVGIIEEADLYKHASDKLAKINPKVVAITGSVGKSTFRKFLSTVLQEGFKVCEGDLNTKLGLAVNIINSMEDGCEVFVAETGMDYEGELLVTGNFIKPDIAALTNISESHLGKLGSLEKIKKSKFDLLYTLKSNGNAFINGDNKNITDALKYAPANAKIIKYGYSGGCEFSSYDFNEIVGKSLKDFEFKFIGIHNYLNILGVVAIAQYLGLPRDKIIVGLKKCNTPKGRLNLIPGINGTILIDDTYNSSPVSCISAIESTSEYYKNHKLSGRKIAILGGMLELGDFEDDGHKKVGEALSHLEFNEIVLVGDLAKKIEPGIKSDNSKKNIVVHYCENSEIAGQYVIEKLKPEIGDIILLKGSQGIRIEKVTKSLMSDIGDADKLLVRQDARWV